jgi:hypothetical protein
MVSLVNTQVNASAGPATSPLNDSLHHLAAYSRPPVSWCHADFVKEKMAMPPHANRISDQFMKLCVIRRSDKDDHVLFSQYAIVERIYLIGSEAFSLQIPQFMQGFRYAGARKLSELTEF